MSQNNEKQGSSEKKMKPVNGLTTSQRAAQQSAEVSSYTPEGPLSEEELTEIREIYYYARLTRDIDDRMRKLFRSGQMLGTFFSQIGQEGCDVPLVYFFRDRDFVGPSHRDLGAHVARKMPIDKMFAQVLTKGESQDRGKMHPIFFGWTPNAVMVPCTILGSQAPVAVGAALTFKITGRDNVAVFFGGEGGTAKGDWHEALNFAGIHKLPFICVVQNNWWAESVAIEYGAGNLNIAARAAGYGMKGYRLDGNDIPALWRFWRELLPKIRSGEHPPALVQLDTYRWFGHSEIDPADYRAKEELEEWQKRDPILRIEKWLVLNNIYTEQEIEAVKEKIKSEIEEAYNKARQMKDIVVEDCLTDVFAPDDFDRPFKIEPGSITERSFKLEIPKGYEE